MYNFLFKNESIKNVSVIFIIIVDFMPVKTTTHGHNTDNTMTAEISNADKLKDTDSDKACRCPFTLVRNLL